MTQSFHLKHIFENMGFAQPFWPMQVPTFPRQPPRSRVFFTFEPPNIEIFLRLMQQQHFICDSNHLQKHISKQRTRKSSKQPMKPHVCKPRQISPKNAGPHSPNSTLKYISRPRFSSQGSCPAGCHQRLDTQTSPQDAILTNQHSFCLLVRHNNPAESDVTGL